MPDEEDKDLTDADEVPSTPLHAHGDDREEDVVGEEKPDVGEEGDLDESDGTETDPPGNPVGEQE